MSAPGDCTCDNECPGESDCACLYSYEDEQCNCDCPGTIIIHLPTLKLESRVAFNTKGCELARLGEFLGKRSQAELLIPASRAREKISLQIEDATFADVLEAAGLVVGGGRQAQADAY